MRFGKGVHLLLWLLIGSLAALGGCDDDDDADLTGIQVDPSVASINMEQTQEFTAVAEYDNGDTEDVTERATWTSSDEDVATVDENGVATPVGEGETTITATFSGEEASAELTVESDGVLESCTVEPTDVSLAVGGTETFTVMGHYSDGSTEDISDAAEWSSDDTSVADVDSDGEVTAIGAGEADIEATVNDIDCDPATVTVTDMACTELTVTADSTSLPIEGTIELTATCVFGEEAIDVTDQVDWSSDDEDVATVDDAGEVTGVAEGTATITAEYTNTDDTTVTGDLELEIVPAALESISITPVTATLNEVGANQQYTATCIYEGGTSIDCTADVTWTSATETVATISNADDSEGEATAVADGTSEITAVLGETTSNIAVLVVDLENVCETIAVSPTDPEIAMGTTVDFTATCTMTDGSTVTDPAGVTWASSAVAVATIDSAGLAEGLTEGTTDITATISVAGTPLTSTAVTLTVTDAEVIGLEISPSVLTLANGMSGNLIATALLSDETTQPVTADAVWTTGDADVATVSNVDGSEGLVEAEDEGTTTITATYAGQTATATVVVTPAFCETLTVDPATASVSVGMTTRLTATCLMSDGTNTTVTGAATWSSDATGVASVDSVAPDHGLVHGVAAGTATITANFDGNTDTAAITVTENVCETLEVTPASPEIADGTTIDFTATCIMTDGSSVTDPDGISWDSSDDTVAGINAEGLATGRAPGTTNITATISVAGAPVVSTPVELTVTDAVVTGLEITPSPLTLPDGTDANLVATAHFSDDTTQNVTVAATWSSDDDTIADVSNAEGSEGLVSGQSPGSTTVRATYEGADAAVAVVVTDSVCESLSISGDASVPAGRDTRLTATCSMSDGTTLDVTGTSNWTSGDTDIAEVGNASPNNGLVTGVAVGTVTITAQYRTVTPATFSIEVTGGVLEGITIEPAHPDPLPDGLHQQFEARGSYSDGTTPLITDIVTWSTGNAAVATISNEDGSRGLATGEGEGVTTITATDSVSGLHATVSLEVTTATIVSIEVSPDTTSIPASFSQQYRAEATLSDGRVITVTNDVTWAVNPSDGSVATISNADGSRGLATGVAAGTATITATDSDSGVVSTPATLNVTAAFPEELIVEPEGTSSAPIELFVGGAQQFTATVIFSDDSERDVTAETNWTLTNSAIGTIDNAGDDRGLLSATAAGSSQVVAVFGGLDTSSYVTVSTPPTVDHVVVSANYTNSPTGFVSQATCRAYYTDGTSADVTALAGSSFDSSDTDTATITNSGVITAVAVGTTNITCSFDDVDSDDPPVAFAVVDCDIDHLEIWDSGGHISDTTTLFQDTSENLMARAYYVDSECSWRDVTDSVSWLSFDTDVATVSNAEGSEGLLTAVGDPSDSTTIEARIVGVAFEQIGVTISGSCYESITIVEPNPDLPVGAQLDMGLEAVTSTGDTVAITTGISWSRPTSMDPNRFTWVSQADGIIEGNAVGDQTLRATISEGTCTGSALVANTTVSVNAAELTSIEIRNIPDGLTIGATHQYQAWAHYSDGTHYDITDDALWNSTVTAVAGIGENTGLATGVAEGTTTITISYESLVDSVSLTVEGRTLDGLYIEVLEEDELISGEAPEDVYLHFQCWAEYVDEGDDSNVTSSGDTSMSVDDPTVLDITGTIVEGSMRTRTLDDGSVIVTCSYLGETATYSLDVNDGLTVTSFTVSHESGEEPVPLVIDEVSQLTATASISNGASFDVTLLSDWSSLDPSSVSVTAGTGQITGVSPTAGVNVSAEYNTNTDSIAVSVSNSCYDGLTVTPASDSIVAGDTTDFVATASVAAGGTTNVTSSVSWHTSDSSVATVAGGTATGQGEGTATITARLTTGLCGGVASPLTDSSTLEVGAAELTALDHIVCPDNMTPYQTGECTAWGYFSDAPSTLVEITNLVDWSVTGTSIDIFSDGAVEAVGIGDSLVTAEYTATGWFQTATITVLNCTLDDVVVTAVDTATVDIPVGFTQAFTASATFTGSGGCGPLDITDLASWDTADHGVATMSGSTMTAVGVGTTNVVATFESVPGTYPVTVNDETLDTLVVSLESSTVYVGEQITVSARGYFTGGYDRDVTAECGWLSTLPAIASFTGPAEVTGNAAGTTLIRCTIGTVIDDETLDVDPACLDHIEVTASESSPLPANVPVTFGVLGYYSDDEPPVDLTTSAGLVWSNYGRILDGAPSEEDGSANTGNVDAVQNLRATITSDNICGGDASVTDILRVRVDADLDLLSLRIIPDPINLAIGQTRQLQAMGTFDGDAEFDLTDRVEWVSSDHGIASVNEDGFSAGVSAGDAIISAVDGLISTDALATVSGAVLSSIEVSAAETLIDGGNEMPEDGHTVQLSACGYYADDLSTCIPLAVDWSITAGATAAAVNADGVLTSDTVSSDTGVTVTATDSAGSGVTGTIDFLITNGALDDVVIVTPDDFAGDINEGETSGWEAHVSNDGGTTWYQATHLVVWSSDNAAIATVSNASGSEGDVVGVAAGATTIRVQSGTLNDAVDLTVLDYDLEYIEIEPVTAYTCPQNTGEQFIVMGHYSDGSARELTSGVSWFAEAWAGDPWYYFYCVNNVGDGTFIAEDDVPEYIADEDCDGVSVRIEACVTVAGGGGTFCTYHVYGGDTHEGVFDIDDSASDCSLPE